MTKWQDFLGVRTVYEGPGGKEVRHFSGNQEKLMQLGLKVREAQLEKGMGRKAERGSGTYRITSYLKNQGKRCRILRTAVGMETSDLCSSPGARWVVLTRE